jgi:hypothetical protein
MNQAVDLMRAVGRTAMDAAQPFLLGLSFFWFAPERLSRLSFSHRTSSR